MEKEGTQTQCTAMTSYFIELLGQSYRGSEEMEEKGKGSCGRGEVIVRRERVEYRVGERLRAGGKGLNK